MPSSFTVLYDASVLYPAPLRDLLMQLALTDLYRARWSEQIHQEWIRSLLKKRPDLTAEQLDYTRQPKTIDQHLPIADLQYRDVWEYAVGRNIGRLQKRY